MIDCDFISKMYTEASTGNYDTIISRFIMNKKEMIYPVRCNVAGICLRTKFIKGLSFDVDYNISEDTLFMRELWSRYKIKKKLVDTNYYYNLGDNVNSLWMKYQRHEIDKNKVMEEK